MAEFPGLQDRLDKKINKYHTPANNPEGVYGGGSYDIFGQIGDNVVPYLQDRINEMFGGTKKTSEQNLFNPDGSIGVTKTKQPKYRSRREGLDATYPAKKPYRSRREGLDATYPDRSAAPPTDPTPDPSPDPSPVPPTPDRGSESDTQTKFQGYEIDLGIAEKSLGRRMADINSFLSENLPVVGYKDQGGREIRPTGDDLSELQGSYADGLISKDQLIFEGISTPGKNGVSPADTADNNRSVRIPGDMDDMDPMFDETGGADDDDFAGPDPEDYATNYSARRTAQRNAFLDPSISSSVEAVRASNNAIGVARFGNNFYANDGGNLRQIDKNAYDKQRSTGLSAEELKGAYVDSVKETLVPVATADAFNVGETPITNAKQTTADYMGDIAETEFNMNNVAPNASDRARMKGDYFNAGDDDDED